MTYLSLFRSAERVRSFVTAATAVNGIPAGQTSAHSPYNEHGPKVVSRLSTILRARLPRSCLPSGMSFRCSNFAPVNRCAAPFGHAATQAPQPIHAAKSRAFSASAWFMGRKSASGAVPAMTEINPPCSSTRSSAERSTTISLTTGYAAERNGSILILSPSLKLNRRCWQAGLFLSGPCGRPLMVKPQVPQIPSRQSEAKAKGSLPC